MGYRDFRYVYPPSESSKIQYAIIYMKNMPVISTIQIWNFFVSVGRDISEILLSCDAFNKFTQSLITLQKKKLNEGLHFLKPYELTRSYRKKKVY